VYLALENRHLVAQHDDLDGEIGVTATDEAYELQHAAERPVEEREGHPRMVAGLGASPQSAAHSRWMTFSARTGPLRLFDGGFPWPSTCEAMVVDPEVQ
jgi:hypothetical protein